DSPLLSDLQNAVPILIKGLGKRETGDGRRTDVAVTFDPPQNGRSTVPASPVSRLPSHVVRAAGAEDPLRIDCALAEKWLVAFLKDEVVTRRGFKQGIVGISGGVDSALTAHLAVKALGKENVIGRASCRERV